MEITHTTRFVEEVVTWIAAEAERVLSARERFCICLCGGNTPRAVYGELAKLPMDWARWVITFGDERCVPPDDAQSNYRMVREAWLEPASVPPTSVLRMCGELEPTEAAADYEKQLRTLFPGADWPEHDVTLLGMGDDGHTASLFPGSEALREGSRWCVPNRVEKLDAWRLTLTYPVLNASRVVAFLVQGAGKQAVAEEIWAGRGEHPAGRIRPTSGALKWFVQF